MHCCCWTRNCCPRILCPPHKSMPLQTLPNPMPNRNALHFRPFRSSWLLLPMGQFLVSIINESESTYDKIRSLKIVNFFSAENECLPKPAAEAKKTDSFLDLFTHCHELEGNVEEKDGKHQTPKVQTNKYCVFESSICWKNYDIKSISVISQLLYHRSANYDV